MGITNRLIRLKVLNKASALLKSSGQCQSKTPVVGDVKGQHGEENKESITVRSRQAKTALGNLQHELIGTWKKLSQFY